MNSNYPCPFWLTFHIFPPINSSTNTLHIEQFRQIVFIFSQRSNPNRRFHLFSFRESVFSGIFSGTGIVWKGVSVCNPPPSPSPHSMRSVHWCETMSDYYCRNSLTGLAEAVISRDSFIIKASQFTLLVFLPALLLCLQYLGNTCILDFATVLSLRLCSARVTIVGF